MDCCQTAGRLKIFFLPATCEALFGEPEGREIFNDVIFTREKLNGWIVENAGWTGESFLTEKAFGVQSSNGLLIYMPETGSARVYLPQNDREPFKSLYRLFWIYFAQVIGEKGACFLHAASIARGGKGYLFIGGTGTGKSTLARYSNNGRVLSDEAPVVSGGPEGLRAYPSPYHQLGPEHHFGSDLISSGVEVKALCFLVMSEETFVQTVSRVDAIAMIMTRHIHFLYCLTPEARAKLFDLFHRACHTLPVYCLHYAINTDIWKVMP